MTRDEGEHHRAFRLVVVVVSDMSMLLDQKAKAYSYMLQVPARLLESSFYSTPRVNCLFYQEISVSL
jgi:hypothetical protein